MTHHGALPPIASSEASDFPICKPAESFGFRLWHVTHAWQRRLEGALAPLDLTHLQFVMLAATAWLSRQGETPSQTRIAGFTSVDRMMVSKILRLLEAKGYLGRSLHPDDTRANRVDLTPTGRAILSRAVDVMRTTQDEFFGRLSAEGRNALAKQLDRLLQLEGRCL
jgi:DNA-binding MarR family transcriptional regulator